MVCSAACTPGTSDGVSTSGDLRPYSTSTCAPTQEYIFPTSPVILPTATLFIYVVEPNDTLIGIADQFSITVEELVSANPDKDPQFLIPGDQMIIPLGGNLPAVPTPTSVPIRPMDTHCYPSADGGLWCSTSVRNEFSDVLENLSVLISLTDSSGQEVTSQEAFGLLDILLPGESMPLAVFFPAPSEQGLIPHAQVLSAVRILPDDPRYLPILLQNTAVNIDWSGRTARISGMVVSPTGKSKAAQVWILGVAYDGYGHVVGMDRWENDAALAAGESLTFEFTVSSQAGDISRVELLAEARP